MSVESHEGQLPASLATALEEFELEFTYPLGDGCRFRISHGADYLRFFRAMGEASLVTVSGYGRIHGSIARVKRHVILKRESDRNPEVLPCHYLGDLKVRADSRGGSVLARLFRETKRQILASDTHACYGVVMGGTGRLPTDYTGRLGVPVFANLAEITILRLSAGNGVIGSSGCAAVTTDELRTVVEQLGVPGYRCFPLADAARSQMVPLHLVTGDDGACGTLEDTRQAKRLFRDSGEEMVSAHLSSFQYRNPEAAGELLRDAVERARAADCPAVFVAVPQGKMAELRPFLGTLEVTEAPATVYGVNIEGETDWWIDTAEI
ncbi:MAG: hypothetical protein EOP88_26445 [Verrucomicrobiaceae bacterium]|nr:MAG: hypothetical protein EOP88_26445 [Verrucomicrobiaceae bacterium]